MKKKDNEQIFYIVIEKDGVQKVVSTNSEPRTFAKQKKARNFITGRRFLQDLNPEIVDNIDGIVECMKVDI
jgi:NifB/MoaA-like Fe-S oxidoreductase